MSRPKMKRDADGHLLVERFPLARRIEHFFGVIVFVTLVVTGLPQKYDQSSLGHAVIALCGGLEMTRLVHRVAGVLFVVHGCVHLGIFVARTLASRMRMELMPTPRDLIDLHENLLYFFRRRAAPPKLPKFDYRQKFEYVGMILGGLVMMFSGLVLLFPVQIANLLGGMIIPIALVLHTSEAVLALLVLVVWHMYTAVLSPDVFPLDRSIVTGYMPLHELEHHHRREYERIFRPRGSAPADKLSARCVLTNADGHARERGATGVQAGRSQVESVHPR